MFTTFQWSKDRSPIFLCLLCLEMLLGYGCEFQPKSSTTSDTPANPVDTVVSKAAKDFTSKSQLKPEKEIKLAKISVDDPAYYGDAFLEKLATINFVPDYLLQDGYMLLGGKDTVLFPLPIGIEEEVNFAANKDSLRYQLTVRQINYTTTIFKFQKSSHDSLLVELSGEAVMNPSFFLGEESDEDDQTGVSYFASEYFHENDTCQMSLRIGNDDEQLRAKIKRYCDDKSYNITLAECPTLRKVD